MRCPRVLDFPGWWLTVSRLHPIKTQLITLACHTYYQWHTQLPRVQGLLTTMGNCQWQQTIANNKAIWRTRMGGMMRMMPEPTGTMTMTLAMTAVALVAKDKGNRGRVRMTRNGTRYQRARGDNDKGHQWGKMEMTDDQWPMTGKGVWTRNNGNGQDQDNNNKGQQWQGGMATMRVGDDHEGWQWWPPPPQGTMTMD